VRVLATQPISASAEKFREEFLLALRLSTRAVKLADMKSSWAGAMGLTQFLPVGVLQIHRRFRRGDGIAATSETSVSDDALASAAEATRRQGLEPGTRWAYEVRNAANCGLHDQACRSAKKPIQEVDRALFRSRPGEIGREELAEAARCCCRK